MQISSNSEAIFLFYRNIHNAKEIHAKILKGEMECAIVKPSLIVDLFQLDLAIHTALLSKERNQMKTRSIYSEIIYNLSGTKKITDSLKTFGFGDVDTEALFVFLDRAKVEPVTSVVVGEVHSLDTLSSVTDTAFIKKLYKIKDSELEVGSLLDGVINRMSTKEYITI